MSNINGQLNIYSYDDLLNGSTIATIDRRASEIYKEIQNRTDIGSEEYNERVDLYYELRRQYKRLFAAQIESESSFKKVTTN